MKRNVLNLAIGVSCGIMMTGCATLFGGGSSQVINIKSDKEMVIDIYKVKSLDANATEEEKNKEPKELGLIYKNVSIPTSIAVNRENKDLLFKSINSDCEDTRVKKEMNDWVWGDILAISLLSTTVDALTGAMWEYDDNVTIECTK